MSSIKNTSVSVLVAIPCYEGQIHSYTANALFSLSKLLGKKGIVSDIITPTGESFLPTVRNKIADTFLISKNYTHLMCIDYDILFDPEDVLTLLDMNVNFAAGIYRLKKQEIEYCYRDNEYTTQNAITEVAYVGAGFSLLNRKLFEKLIDSNIVNKNEGVNGANIWDFYSPVIEDGFLLPDDVSFCRRCIKAKEKVYINRTIHLGHFGGAIYG
jgi:hypothetical protein